MGRENQSISFEGGVEHMTSILKASMQTKERCLTHDRKVLQEFAVDYEALLHMYKGTTASMNADTQTSPSISQTDVDQMEELNRSILLIHEGFDREKDLDLISPQYAKYLKMTESVVPSLRGADPEAAERTMFAAALRFRLTLMVYLGSGLTKIAKPLLSPSYKGLQEIEANTALLRNICTSIFAVSQENRSEKYLELFQTFQESLSSALKRFQHAVVVSNALRDFIEYHREEPARARKANAEITGGSAAGMKEAETRYKALMTATKQISKPAVTAFLDRVFAGARGEKARQIVREACGLFSSLEKEETDSSLLLEAIKGLLEKDLLNEKKKNILRAVIADDLLLSDLAEIITHRCREMTTFEWSETVPLETRRLLNGKYRVFMDEDILDAVQIHWIGSKLCFSLRAALCKAYEECWVRDEADESAEALLLSRVKEKLGIEARRFNPKRKETIPQSIGAVRAAIQFGHLYLSALPSDQSDIRRDRGYDFGNRDEYSFPCFKHKFNAAQIKQLVLRLFLSDAEFHLATSGSFTAVQTDFKDFGPSLSHDLIVTFLEYFHFSPNIIAFIQRFLRAPCHFASNPSDSFVRSCGVPLSHVLTDALGELILWCLDFHVNQSTRGTVFVYRNHDDVCFWHKSADVCEKVWSTYNEGVNILGLKLNTDKTGSLSVDVRQRGSQETTTDDPAAAPTVSKLPQTPFRWGFLIFGPNKAVSIDEEQLQYHTKEIIRQIRAFEKRGAPVLELIRAWNIYFSQFCSYNFGPSLPTLGVAQAKAVYEHLVKIQRDTLRELVPNATGPVSLVAYVREKLPLPDGMDASELCEAFYWWPISLGGLGIKNPLTILIFTKSAFEAEERRAKQALIHDREILGAESMPEDEVLRQHLDCGSEWLAHQSHVYHALADNDVREFRRLSSSRGGDASYADYCDPYIREWCNERWCKFWRDNLETFYPQGPSFAPYHVTNAAEEDFFDAKPFFLAKLFLLSNKAESKLRISAGEVEKTATKKSSGKDYRREMAELYGGCLTVAFGFKLKAAIGTTEVTSPSWAPIGIARALWRGHIRWEA